jgi:hypothetical protein
VWLSLQSHPWGRAGEVLDRGKAEGVARLMLNLSIIEGGDDVTCLGGGRAEGRDDVSVAHWSRYVRHIGTQNMQRSDPLDGAEGVHYVTCFSWDRAGGGDDVKCLGGGRAEGRDDVTCGSLVSLRTAHRHPKYATF